MLQRFFFVDSINSNQKWKKKGHEFRYLTQYDSSCYENDLFTCHIDWGYVRTIRPGYIASPRGVLSYISHKGMCRPKGYGFWAFLAWKQVFTSSGLESGMVFDGTTGVYERIYPFNSKWLRKKEKYANSKRIWRILFICALI